MAHLGAYFQIRLYCTTLIIEVNDMQIKGNTILITGGGSGIGRGLAEAFHQAGNKVVIAGRRRQALDAVVAANPGMEAVTGDVQTAAGVTALAAEVAAKYPALNVVIHNAGIMRMENLKDIQAADVEATVSTNLLGPIRLTAALLPVLLKQPQATILTLSSGLAFLPLTATPTYSATKAGIHSWSQSLRWQLRDTKVQVIELPPPYVQTELLRPEQATDPDAMPLAEFIAEVMQILETNPAVEEVLVERVKPLRFAEVNGTFPKIFAALNNRGY